MRKIKDPWRGTCPICGLPDQKLETNKITFEGMLYITKKTCYHCHIVIRNAINSSTVLLRADARQLLSVFGEKEKR